MAEDAELEIKQARLLWFNLMTDADDPILGFASRWLSAAAAYCERIDVLTMQAGRVDLPDNVRVVSVGRERGYSEVRRALNFYAHLLRWLTSERYDACFAHMMPLFAGMGGPLLTVRGVPTTLWYTQPAVSHQLRLGLAMSRHVVSADHSSFPLETPKLQVLGHGIDTDFFTPEPNQPPDDPPLAVLVGRLTAIKHQHVVLHALAGLKDVPLRVVLVGDVPQAYADDYQQRLHALVAELGLGERVTFAGAQDAAGVRQWYQRATLNLNLTPPGSFDKTVLEGMACGLPTVTANPAFDALMGPDAERLQIRDHRDADALRARLRAVLSLSAAERAAMGARLRAQVVREHSLTRLMQRLLKLLLHPPPRQMS